MDFCPLKHLFEATSANAAINFNFNIGLLHHLLHCFNLKLIFTMIKFAFRYSKNSWGSQIVQMAKKYVYISCIYIDTCVWISLGQIFYLEPKNLSSRWILCISPDVSALSWLTFIVEPDECSSQNLSTEWDLK